MIQILKNLVGEFVGKFVLKAQTIPIGELEGLRYWFSKYVYSRDDISRARAYWPDFIKKNDEYQHAHSSRAVKINRSRFTAPGGVQLDTVELSPTKSKPDGYIIYGWGRNNHYEMYLSRMAKDAVNLNKRIISFNYRGVGYSKGRVLCEHDLVSDYLFQIERLIRKGVDPKKIQCYGHSLGGAVATIAVHELGLQSIRLKLFNDRSFGNLIDTSVALFFKRKSRRRRFVNTTTMVLATLAFFPMLIWSSLTLPVLIFSWLGIAAATMSDLTHFIFDKTVGNFLEKGLAAVMHFGGWYMHAAPKYDNLPLNKKSHMLIHQPQSKKTASKLLGKIKINTPSEDRVIFYEDSMHKHANRYHQHMNKVKVDVAKHKPQSNIYKKLKKKLNELNMVKVSGGDHTADPAQLKSWYPHHQAKRHVTGQELIYNFFDPEGQHCSTKQKKYKSH